MTEIGNSGPGEWIKAALLSSPDFSLAVLETLRVLSLKFASEADCGWMVKDIMEEIKSINVNFDAFGDLEAQIISALLREAKAGVVERNGKLWRLSEESPCLPYMREGNRTCKSSVRKTAKRRKSRSPSRKRKKQAKKKMKFRSRSRSRSIDRSRSPSRSIKRSKSRSRSRSRSRSKSRLSKEAKSLVITPAAEKIKQENNEESEKRTAVKRSKRKDVYKSPPATENISEPKNSSGGNSIK